VPETIQWLDAAAVQKLTGLPRSTFYDLKARGDFPAPTHLVPGNSRVVLWQRSQVEAWLRARANDGISGVMNPFMRNKSASDISPVVRPWLD
jgi:predicted DNA-binding transcriptional regulator AlpA